MSSIDPRHGIGTLVTHVSEMRNPLNAHVTPIYQTSTFNFPDVQTGAARFKGEEPGYIYTRLNNPNLEQLALKIAVLEGLDLLRAQPDRPVEEICGGLVFASGMAAITAAILARVKGGQTIIAQENIYSATYNFLHDLAPQYDITVIWVTDPRPEGWESAFKEHPEAILAYAETPANPNLSIVDLAAVAKIAHHAGAWLMVDNTFATPFCQRPLALGADIVVHSTTKYISGHGQVIGGAVASSQMEYVKGPLHQMFKILGGCPSPFDAWLANIGLKTFEVRMERHCENALKIAAYLEDHPKIARVYYPFLPSHPDFQLAQTQMKYGGAMIAFEVKGGVKAGAALMDHVRVSTLAVSLGNVDSLISHPASMTHSTLPAEVRQAMGISDGLVRYSIGIENVADLINDLDQALRFT
ncbi:MAG: aminotransferase class I/II-fold pyridoxal phosphate-dependent enzyme [Anaerolineaceae bacterium]|nr:aminotransferase class I/II-fold pyridoxal phosphate-dependent enzyme [Anaerolineaceae bacterium]